MCKTLTGYCHPSANLLLIFISPRKKSLIGIENLEKISLDRVMTRHVDKEKSHVYV